MWSISFINTKEEEALVVYVNEMNEKGIPIMKKELKSKALKILIKKNSKSSEDTLGDDWWKLFKKHNPQLCEVASSPTS